MAKETLKEKLAKRRQQISERSERGNIIYPKEGTIRFRVLPVGEDNDWAQEVTQFYLGPEIQGVFSPSTFGESCPIMEAYKELKESKKDSEKDLAKTLSPRKKYLVPVVVFADDRGNKIDEEKSNRLLQLPSGIYAEMIDNFLDPDLGDFTDPAAGYDYKLKRTGKGKMDTVYTITPMRPSALPEKYHKEFDLETAVRKEMLSYDRMQEKLDQFLVGGPAKPHEEDDEDEAPRKKGLSGKDKLKQKRNQGDA